MTAAALKLHDLGPGQPETYVTVEMVTRARATRIVEAQRVNPSFNASSNQMIGSPETTALYLTTLWDDDVGAVPKSWIRSWFGKLTQGTNPQFK